MADKQKPHEDVLTRLVRGLETKKTLCHVKDYPGVELKELNLRVKKLGPLVNPVFGEQPAFFIDEGRFIPYRIVVRLSTESTWTYRGEPFVPTFVVEIEKLSGRGSQRRALDRKMRNEYFQHGVQLGWLIDPRPDFQRMYEYYLDDNGDVQCSDNTAWRDLDGGDVLPGFTLVSTDLEMVLNQDSGSSSEEEIDLVCPIPRCRKRFKSLAETRSYLTPLQNSILAI
ncbi:hypothetical protein PC113_g18407 [Phytophthora cactorum]|uniref:Restriction endonuclease domain-containing protein n=1 Tax=Phytophthora cactorum TaxID=29920 RepID=A0A8T0YG98_9STRA|nr:hypothetical protein PC113_g18407 [Phytophthora cactorum]